MGKSFSALLRKLFYKIILPIISFLIIALVAIGGSVLGKNFIHYLSEFLKNK